MNTTKSTKLMRSNWRFRCISRNCTLAVLLTLAPAALGQFTQNTVTGSRALNTAYQNVSGVPQITVVTVLGSATGPTTLDTHLLTDAANPPTTQTSGNYVTFPTNVAIVVPVFAIVCPNNYAKVTATASGTPSINDWIETTIDDVGSGCTQSVVTGSRAIGTIYHNTSMTQTVWVSVTCNSSAGDTCTAFTDSAATPTTRVGYSGCSSGGHNCVLFFPVLPQYYYQITRGGDATLTSWVETLTNTPPGMQETTPARTIGIPVSHFVYSAGTNAVFVTASMSGGVVPGGSLVTFDAPTSSVVAISGQSQVISVGSFLIMPVPSTWSYKIDYDQSSFSDQVWVEWTTPNTPPATQRNHAYVF